MKRSGIRKNNRGDSLILVIGCIALLSIVGVILLAKTMDNRSMKMAEEQAQASFAGAESGSAEMVTVLETVTLDVIEDAFEDMLLEYSLMENDAIREVMRYLFDEVGMNRVGACHDSNNPKSGRVMQKAGMKYEGTLRGAGRNNQGIMDEVWYGLLKADRE